jgi:pyruvate dehydrogenase E1 component alpha subunit
MTDQGGDRDPRIGWYRKMVEIRLFEDKVQELFMRGLIEGTTHLCQGQEAVSVGAVAAMRADDVLTNTYRGHGQALARGMAPEVAFAELMGRATGCCGGVGGSMHLTDFAAGNIGAFAIVGAGLPVALGAAMASKLRGGDSVALTFLGDGATNIGTFHEALNMAALWKAPIVVIIENNLYGEYSPLRSTTPVDDLAVRAQSYAMPGVIVDGQAIEVVRREVSAAIDRARSGEGPRLLEMKTYRYAGHSRADTGPYRPEGELEAWQARDPITLYADDLVRDGVVDTEGIERLRTQVGERLDALVAAMREAPEPDVDAMFRHVTAD